MKEKNLVKLQGLQIGRGLAALAVVIFHAKLILIRFPENSYIKLPFFYSHGDIGVPFFFVISGFIICYVIDKKSFVLSIFLIKRFFRLWPTYFFCTTLYVAIYLVHRNLPAVDVGYGFKYIITSILLLPLPVLPALQPGWSLEHEVLFYLFASVVAVFFGVRGVFYGLIAAVLVSIFFRLILPEMSGVAMQWDYHLLAPINLCFLFGVGLYLFWRSRSDIVSGSASQHWVLLLGVILILAAPYIVEKIPFSLNHSGANRDLRLGFIRFAIESTASVILLYGLLGINSQSFFAKLFTALGDRSYSLYLSHFMLIPIFQYVHREIIHWPQGFAEPLCILFVVLAILLAYLVYWSVERPSSLYGVRLAN